MSIPKNFELVEQEPAFDPKQLRDEFQAILIVAPRDFDPTLLKKRKISDNGKFELCPGYEGEIESANKNEFFALFPDSKPGKLSRKTPVTKIMRISKELESEKNAQERNVTEFQAPRREKRRLKFHKIFVEDKDD